MNRHFIGPLTAAQLKRRKARQSLYRKYLSEEHESFWAFLKWQTEKKYYVAPPGPGEYP